MIDIPEWLEKHVAKVICPDCGKPINRKAISGIGIKEYKKKNGVEKYIFVEHTCIHCKKTYALDICHCDVKDFVFSMMEKYTGGKGAATEDELDDIISDNNSYDHKEIGKRDRHDDGVGYDSEEDDRIKSNASQVHVPGMTDKEAQEAKESIEASESDKEMLLRIGIIEDDLKKLVQEDTKDGGNNA
jgi:hypothetical protein